MRYEHRWGVVVIMLLTSLQLGACRQSSEATGQIAIGAPKVEADEEDARPAVVEHLEGAEPVRVTLTAEAAKRIDVQTDAVREVEVDGTMRKVIPYAAVLYDTEGGTWTYTNPQGRVYVRHPITVIRISGELAVLSDGPPLGTAVVTVGVAELFGAESEFEEE